MYRNLIKVFFSLVVLLANLSFFITFDDESGKKNTAKQYQKNIQFIDSNKSEKFNYKCKVDINSIKSGSRYIPIKFSVNVEPKINEKLENVSVTGYIDDIVFNNIADKSYNKFSISEVGHIDANTINPDGTSISISKATYLYDDTNIDKLIENLKGGIKVKVAWDKQEEYVVIKDVEVNQMNLS